MGTDSQNAMERSVKKRRITLLIICLALAVVIPNILLVLFAGKAAKPVIYIASVVIILSAVMVVYGALAGMLTALTRGPVAPSTLVKQCYKELIKDTSKVRKSAVSSVKAVLEAFHENERFILQEFRYNVAKDHFICPGSKTFELQVKKYRVNRKVHSRYVAHGEECRDCYWSKSCLTPGSTKRMYLIVPGGDSKDNGVR